MAPKVPSAPCCDAKRWSACRHPAQASISHSSTAAGLPCREQSPGEPRRPRSRPSSRRRGGRWGVEGSGGADLRVIHEARAEALDLLVGCHRAEGDLTEALRKALPASMPSPHPGHPGDARGAYALRACEASGAWWPFPGTNYLTRDRRTAVKLAMNARKGDYGVQRGRMHASG